MPFEPCSNGDWIEVGAEIGPLKIKTETLIKVLNRMQERRDSSAELNECLDLAVEIDEHAAKELEVLEKLK